MITDRAVAAVDDVLPRILVLIAERKAALDAAEGVARAAAGRPLTQFEGSLLDGFLDDFDRADGQLSALVDVGLERRQRSRLVRLVRRLVRTGPRAGVTSTHQAHDEGNGYR